MFNGRAFALFLLAAVGFVGSAAEASACGPDSDCMVGERHYRIRLPESYDPPKKIGALVFSHGRQGTARGIIASKKLSRIANELGVALIAVKSTGQFWAIPGAPSIGAVAGTNELAYFDAVLEDAASRFAIDETRIVASGFSAGAMMTWTLACERPDRFAAFIPIAGTFWRPIPNACKAPVASIAHLHGNNDPIVPLDGRIVFDGHQGEVTDVLDMYARFGDFEPAGKTALGPLRCDDQINKDDRLLRFCLFDGDHTFDAEIIAMTWRALEARGIIPSG